MFVNIPAIANYEWHPFTLSSAPEDSDYIWLHIRGVGEWTNRLHNYFAMEHKRLHDGEVPPLMSNGKPTEDGGMEKMTAVELFNEHVNISGNSNGPEKMSESKISPLVTHNNGKAIVDPIKKFQGPFSKPKASSFDGVVNEGFSVNGGTNGTSTKTTPSATQNGQSDVMVSMN